MERRQEGEIEGGRMGNSEKKQREELPKTGKVIKRKPRNFPR